MFKVNEYFEGKVKSIGFTTAEGAATVGVMAQGEYDFGTSTVEIMTVTSGALQVRLPGESAWRAFAAGETFEVPANSSFEVEAEGVCDYCCSYIAE